MVNILNLFVRFSLWIIMSLLFIPVGEFIKRFCPKARIRTANLYHTLLCKILGIKMIIKGKQDLEGPVFFVSNHQSYLDIPVISCVTRARFVSKSEVRKWPLIGYLAELQNTIFIKRDKKEAGRQSSQLSENIKAGDSIIAFPEGTSGDGHKVLKFKSTLFSIADEKVKYGEEERYLKVQPISIYFSKLNGEPVTYHDTQKKQKNSVDLAN